MVRAAAASGLVDRLALHRAAAAVASQRPSSADEFDRRLAERLVESGAINAWQADQLRRGRTKFSLGPYRILDSIARGGMGHVFKCEHELLGRVEAIKVLPGRKSTPESVESFRNEIRAQAALDHPNLVRVSYADRDGPVYFLVTEYVPGIDLRRLVRRNGPLDPDVAAWVVAQSAEAIDHAHRRGFVHRDVKPGNVLLTPSGNVKLTDLGLAWSLQAAWSANGAGLRGAAYSGKVAGTSDYLAPEAIRTPSRVRPESDLYSLGCTLYYAVTGKVPYPGGAHVDKLRRRLREEPRDVLELAPRLSPEMAAVVRELMASRPEDRPTSAREVVERLMTDDAPAARLRLAGLVTDAVARRGAADDSSHTWTSGEAHDLPETVGLPLHDIDPNDPGAATRETTDSPPRWTTPRVVTALALLATVAMLLASIW